MVNDNLNFNYGNEVSPSFGCAVTLHGQSWYFGGNEPQYKRQVSFEVMIVISKWQIK